MGLGSEPDSDKNSKLQRYLCAVKNIKAYRFQTYTVFKQESQLSKKSTILEMYVMWVLCSVTHV